MTIGIDISQLAFAHTGVANLLKQLVNSMIDEGQEHDFVLFYSSMRIPFNSNWIQPRKNVRFKLYKFPPTFLDVLWNRLHIIPIEHFIGEVDVFISSDWTEPPANKARKLSILYDLVVLKYPEESTKKIIETQKRKLKHLIKETQTILCISESTARDAEQLLKIDEKRLKVVYPALTL